MLRFRSRPGRSRAGRIALLVVFGALLINQRAARRSRSSAGAPANPAHAGSTEKYKPAGDEGLGASIALLLDQSGSMAANAKGDKRPKYVVAREALNALLEATDSFVARQPGFPVNVGLYTFSGDVKRIVPVKPYSHAELASALASLARPDGATAIGDAMDLARQDLYRAGTIRKYILVITDGENTNGRSPEAVAREIDARSEGAVRQFFVAFDVDAKQFAFLRSVRGEVLGAANGDALRASLDTIYRGRILAEAMNAGETLPPARSDAKRDSGTSKGKKQ
ncbi:MAG TPA: vWA domain-containing protein [Gemmatimonadaceae bacterium]|nr:vWA domain-containing protein [Gemmatimonadaceae bacterium]